MRIKRVIISIFTLIYILSPFVSANAASSYLKGYGTWKPSKTEIVNKSNVKLSFTKKLSKIRGAYITDKANKKVKGKYKVNLSKNKKSITISPNKILIPGKGYRIYIKNAVYVSKGKYKSIVIPFVIPKQKKTPFIQNIDVKAVNDKVIFTVKLSANVSKVTIETENKKWNVRNNKGSAKVTLSNIKGGSKYTLTAFDLSGKQLEKKEGTTPKLVVVEKNYLKEVTFHYNSMITNTLMHTTEEVFKVTVEYNGYTLEAHYSGAQVFDIGLQSATVGSKIKIRVYDDRDKLLQTKEVIITATSTGDSSDDVENVPVIETTIADVKVNFSNYLTNITVETDEKTFKVLVEYNKQKFVTHYSGSNKYDIGISNVKKGDKLQILAYDDSDKLIESKEVSVN